MDDLLVWQKLSVWNWSVDELNKKGVQCLDIAWRDHGSFELDLTAEDVPDPERVHDDQHAIND
ncbi:hypothetical protein VC83_07506 [Pseudogymnoascus destructans]|uniref:Uncharacterized protein n=1 Tax=Pseudogymnoascus destructans TaxID=655981 RepID=A0A177A3F2_9PEZI|nr:uncharacterized protein VC83_07506 [Pseudogymnoascus destructans]OAF56120.1 hypothetical protein VC83_07506 [Pseudogymnoascus destructans]